jgi:hypothetical protein
MPKKEQKLVVANPLSGYTPLNGGWDNSTTHQPDTIDRKGQPYHAPDPSRKERRSFGIDHGDQK